MPTGYNGNPLHHGRPNYVDRWRGAKRYCYFADSSFTSAGVSAIPAAISDVFENLQDMSADEPLEESAREIIAPDEPG